MYIRHTCNHRSCVLLRSLVFSLESLMFIWMKPRCSPSAARHNHPTSPPHWCSLECGPSSFPMLTADPLSFGSGPWTPGSPPLPPPVSWGYIVFLLHLLPLAQVPQPNASMHPPATAPACPGGHLCAPDHLFKPTVCSLAASPLPFAPESSVCPCIPPLSPILHLQWLAPAALQELVHVSPHPLPSHCVPLPLISPAGAHYRASTYPPPTVCSLVPLAFGTSASDSAFPYPTFRSPSSVGTLWRASTHRPSPHHVHSLASPPHLCAGSWIPSVSTEPPPHARVVLPGEGSRVRPGIWAWNQQRSGGTRTC